jgi:hypothetical protein
VPPSNRGGENAAATAAPWPPLYRNVGPSAFRRQSDAQTGNRGRGKPHSFDSAVLLAEHRAPSLGRGSRTSRRRATAAAKTAAARHSVAIVAGSVAPTTFRRRSNAPNSAPRPQLAVFERAAPPGHGGGTSPAHLQAVANAG